MTAHVPSMAIPLHCRASEATTLMNATNQLPPEILPDLLLDVDRLGRIYNEETFRYFLSLEEKRSDRSRRRLLLLLVDLKEDPGTPGTVVRLVPGIAVELFGALRACLRDTDFVGWYREGHVAGAVLTHIGDTGEADISTLITQRVGEALQGNLPPHVASRLRMLVYQLPPATDRS
jgi:hypothetical protein